MRILTLKGNDKMPMIGLGTWKSQPGEVYFAVKTAIEIGYRHFDCSPRYGNENEIGKALHDCIKEGKVRRNELWITSKLWNSYHRHNEVVPALQNTLKDLQLEYLDLFLIHWPVVLEKIDGLPQSGDELISLEEIPLHETWSGMEDCAESGLAKHIGVSNFSIDKLQGILNHANIRPEMNQVELHPFLQQHTLLEFCLSERIHVTGYSPLGSMDRNSMLRNSEEPILFEQEVILDLANKYDCTAAQILLGWGLQRGTALVPKSVNRGRMLENLAADRIRLSTEEMQDISLLDRHYRYISGTIWTIPGSPYTLANLWDE